MSYFLYVSGRLKTGFWLVFPFSMWKCRGSHAGHNILSYCSILWTLVFKHTPLQFHIYLVYKISCIWCFNMIVAKWLYLKSSAIYSFSWTWAIFSCKMESLWQNWVLVLSLNYKKKTLVSGKIKPFENHCFYFFFL